LHDKELEAAESAVAAGLEVLAEMAAAAESDEATGHAVGLLYHIFNGLSGLPRVNSASPAMLGRFVTCLFGVLDIILVSILFVLISAGNITDNF
jgi:hypothetical protein